MEKIMEPASWFATLFYKPAWFAQAMVYTLPWMISTRYSVTTPRALKFVQTLRTSPPPFPTDNLKVGAAGFCWGGKHTVILAQDAPSSRVHRHESQINSAKLEPLLDCAFTAHPSFINVPGDIQAVTIPLSVAIGQEDMAMKAPHIQDMKRILEAEKLVDHEVNIIPGAKHGFAVRTRPDDSHEMECAERAEVQAVEWFTKWFA